MDSNPSSRPFTRLFVAAGQTWTVREEHIPFESDRSALIFASDRVARRVIGYPATWQDLSVGQLYALSWHR